MNDPLDFVLDVHGGLVRWSGVSRLRLTVTPLEAHPNDPATASR